MTEDTNESADESYYPAVMLLAKKPSDSRDRAVSRARSMRSILSRDSALTMYEIGESEVLNEEEYEEMYTESVKDS